MVNQKALLLSSQPPSPLDDPVLERRRRRGILVVSDSPEELSISDAGAANRQRQQERVELLLFFLAVHRVLAGEPAKHVAHLPTPSCATVLSFSIDCGRPVFCENSFKVVEPLLASWGRLLEYRWALIGEWALWMTLYCPGPLWRPLVERHPLWAPLIPCVPWLQTLLSHLETPWKLLGGSCP